MGFFPRYDREGPGVYADDPKHGPFVRFFQTYANKFFKIVSANFLTLLFNIPAIIVAYAGVIYFLPQINPMFEPAAFQKYLMDLGISAADSATSGEGAALQIYFLVVVVLVMFVVGMQLVSVGPVQTGLSYVYRNFARETTTFVWSDFVMSFKKNWKQSLIVTGITLVLTCLILINIVFYANVYNGPYAQIFSTIFFMAFVFFMCIQIYMYPIIASLDLKLKNVYRNAVLFFLGRLLPTLGIFLVDTVILLVIPVVMIVSFTYAGFALAIIYYLLFAFSFVQYLNTFFVWQQIERYIVKPQEIDEQSPEAAK